MGSGIDGFFHGFDGRDALSRYVCRTLCGFDGEGRGAGG